MPSVQETKLFSLSVVALVAAVGGDLVGLVLYFQSRSYGNLLAQRPDLTSSITSNAMTIFSYTQVALVVGTIGLILGIISFSQLNDKKELHPRSIAFSKAAIWFGAVAAVLLVLFLIGSNA